MKVRSVLAAFAAVTAGGVVPLAAQTTRVTAPLPQRGDSMAFRFTMTRVSEERLRDLLAQVMQLSASNKEREGLLVRILSDSSQSRRAALMQEELGRAGFDLMSKQSELYVACLSVRPQAGEIPGTLGIDVDGESIEWIHDRSGERESLTMVFGATPPRVKSVASGSPAERAGVQPGDVWVSINGRSLVGPVRFDELLHPGRNVAIRVARSGREIELPSVAVAAKPGVVTDSRTELCDRAREYTPVTPILQMYTGTVSGAMRPPVPAGRMSPRTGAVPEAGARMFVLSATPAYAGARLEAMDDAWRNILGMKVSGVVVLDVGAGTPAAAAGLQKFDVITRANDIAVTSPMSLQVLASENRVLELTVTARDGATRVVKVAR